MLSDLFNAFDWIESSHKTAFFSSKVLISLMRAQQDLSYHLICEPWMGRGGG